MAGNLFATYNAPNPTEIQPQEHIIKFENLNPDTTYTIRVEAIDLSGNIGGISQQVKTKSQERWLNNDIFRV